MNSKKLDVERAEQAVEYVNTHYSIKDFLIEKGIISSSYTSNAVVCLANDDKTPSMKINYNTNQFNCFSCSTSGNYISMVVHYKKDVLSQRTNYYSELEKILRQDLQMRTTLGFDSIYKKNEVEIVVTGFKRKITKKAIITRRYLNKKYTKMEDKIQVINLAQMGYTFDKIEEIMSQSEEEILDI